MAIANRTDPCLRIGTAGWSVTRPLAGRLGGEGTHLERYARHFHGVEINSSFYRPHAAATYARWASATPPGFQFAVKVPRLITHDQCLVGSRALLEAFLDETSGLGAKRGPLLVQLPPSLALNARIADRFFVLLRARYQGAVVFEPRHASWWSPRGEALLAAYEIARVAADPPPVPGADRPGGWEKAVYYRLHGSPRKYWSKYDAGRLAALADALRTAARSAAVWCVFDNTASGAALENAWELAELTGRGADDADG